MPPDGGSADADAAQVDATPPDVEAPHLLAPLSTATVTSRRPTLRWQLPAGADGAHVDLCVDRACTQTLAAIDVTGSSATPIGDLPAGVVFWRAYGRSGARVGHSPTPTWQMNVGTRSAPVDSSSGTTLDLNGDGYADLVVATPSGNGGSGQVYVYLADPSAAFPGRSPVVLNGLSGAEAGSFGQSVASAGDVNGDGYADLIVGADYEKSTGQAYIFLGGPTGVAAGQTPTVVTGPDNPHEEFGFSVSSAGDVNGDGYADVIVGADEAVNNLGRAYIYLGGPNGVSATQQPTVPTGPDGFGGNPATQIGDALFGHSVAGAGDVNGDGYADVVVGAPYAGRAYVYLGGPGGISSAQVPVRLLSPDNGGEFGGAVAGAGDVNGDGYADVVVGDYGAASTDGRAYVFLGGPAAVLASAPPITLIGGVGDGGLFGNQLAGAGDVDGDGFADIVVGAGMGGGDQSGRAYVFFGGSSGVPAPAQPVVLSGSSPGPIGFGRAVAGAGDTDGDGLADVLVSADGIGTVYLYRGNASRTFPAAATFVGPAALSFFGYALY